MFRCRVEKSLLQEAHKVSKQMGTSTAELVRMFMKALVKQRTLPFVPKAETEEDEMLGPIQRRRTMLDFLHDH